MNLEHNPADVEKNAAKEHDPLIMVSYLTGLVVLVMVAASCIASASYWLGKQRAIAEAQAKADLLLNCVDSSLEFFEKAQKPLAMQFTKKTAGLYPELTNKFMVTREFTDILHKKSTKYKIHLATLNPLNDKNKADFNETQIINDFRSHPKMTSKEGLINNHGKLFYYKAYPITVSKAACLACHAKPEDAPWAQVVLYGTEHGYNWNLAETISAKFAYVSVLKELKWAKKTAIKIFIITFICFLLTFLPVIYLLKFRNRVY